MSTWYYYDKNGFKQGPMTSGQLKGLAMQGVITPETKVETETGKSASAKQVKGLTFAEPAPPKPAPPPLVEPDSMNWDDLLATESQVPSRPPSPLPARNHQRTTDWLGIRAFWQVVGWRSIAAIVFIAGAMIVVFCTTSLEGKWVQQEENPFAASIELFKGGTGLIDGHRITWESESVKAGRRSYHYYLHLKSDSNREKITVKYTLLFSTLTLEFADGNVKYKKQKDDAANTASDSQVERELFSPEVQPNANPYQPSREVLQTNERQMQESREKVEQMREQAQQQQRDWHEAQQRKNEEFERQMHESREKFERQMQESREKAEQMREQALQRHREWQQQMEAQQRRRE